MRRGSQPGENATKQPNIFHPAEGKSSASGQYTPIPSVLSGMSDARNTYPAIIPLYIGMEGRRL